MKTKRRKFKNEFNSYKTQNKKNTRPRFRGLVLSSVKERLISANSRVRRIQMPKRFVLIFPPLYIQRIKTELTRERYEEIKKKF